MAVGMVALLAGCNTTQPHSVPVVDAGVPMTDKPDDVAMVNTHAASSQSTDSVAQAIPQGASEAIEAIPQDTSNDQVVTGIPLKDDNSAAPLDNAVLALLTTAQQQQDAGNLNKAAASIERAQRIAPSDPRVLSTLAFIRLKQGDAAAAEQLAKRALSYTSESQTDLRSNLWEIVAQAREQQGDTAGANEARQHKAVRV